MMLHQLSRVSCRRAGLLYSHICQPTTHLLVASTKKCNLPNLHFLKRSFSLDHKIGQPHSDTHPHLLLPNELTKGIHKDEFKRRREKYADAMAPHSVAVFFSAPEKIMSANIPYENHHDTQVSYLSGFQETSAILVLEKHVKGYTYSMFVRKRDPAREIWDGPVAGTEIMGPVFGCEKAYSLQQAKEILKPILSRASIIYHTKKAWPEMTRDLELDTTFSGKVETDTTIQEHRLIKSPAEIELMKTAGAINGECFAKAMEFTRPGMIEWMVTAKIEFESKMKGAQRLAYPPVSAAGPNGLSMHYVHNSDVLRDGETILVDAGCEYHGYCSDITRVWPVGKKFSSYQKAIYEVVLDCNKRCIEMAEPGMSLGSLHAKASEMLHDNLVKIGVLSKRAMYGSAFKKLYPHALGHYLGMDLHDSPDLSTHKKLQPGMVITIEPGLYIWPHPTIPERFHNIAVRVEDDILITEGKPIVLTKGAPKEIADIEALRKYISLKYLF